MIEPRSDPIVAAFERLADRAPDAPLLVSGGRSVVRGEVSRLARSLAERLAGDNASPVVALAAPNGSGFFAGLLALRRLGRAILLLDWTMRDNARRVTAAAMGASKLLVCRDPWPASAEAFEALAVPEPRSPPDTAAEAAVLKLTSGSSGAPRAVVASAAALVADERALARTMGLADDERILAAVPMAHSYGLSSVAMPALLRGSVVAVPEAPGPFAAFEAAAAGGVTFLPTVPAYLAALLAMASPPPLPASVRLVVSAGAPLDPAVARAFRERYGQPVHVFYGASECGGICFDREGGAGERGTVGRPVAGVEIALEPVPGAPVGGGRPIVRSPAVAAGYHPPSPELAGGRFVTGDLAVWRDGELALTGRADDLINVKGKKIDPRAVEDVLRRLKGVADAAVFGLPLAEGGAMAVSAVVACSPQDLSRERIRTWCRRHLPAHQVPRRIVRVDELPLTGRGKLDRRALISLAAAPDPETVG